MISPRKIPSDRKSNFNECQHYQSKRETLPNTLRVHPRVQNEGIFVHDMVFHTLCNRNLVTSDCSPRNYAKRLPGRTSTAPGRLSFHQGDNWIVILQRMHPSDIRVDKSFDRGKKPDSFSPRLEPASNFFTLTVVFSGGNNSLLWVTERLLVVSHP